MTDFARKSAGQLDGWFHREAQQQEEQMVVLGHYKQFVPLIIPVDVLGVQNPINVSGNGLHLVPQMAVGQSNGKLADLIVSSLSARVLVRLNSESNPWFPFSQLIAPQGDFQYIAATIAKIWFAVAVVDGVLGTKMCFVVVNNAGLSSTTGGSSSAGSYSVPAGAISGAGGGAAGAGGSSGGGARSMIRTGGGPSF